MYSFQSLELRKIFISVLSAKGMSKVLGEGDELFKKLEDVNNAGNKDYIFYNIYSLCKLKVIYNVAIDYPEAGAFAPCSMAIYQKKGSDKMVIVFPNVHNPSTVY